ncbi:MAG: MFS transporter [Acetobacteraceae bacterium]|nr:MFS transporter [Acetobacteraceae bacterium]
MALSRTTRVNLLISNGHFLSHFYVLCMPTMFLTWRDAFEVSFTQLGMTIAMMSATTALLQTPVGFLVDKYGARPFLVGGTLLMSLSIASMSLATSFWQIQLLAVMSGIGNSVVHPADYAILSGSIDKDRMGRSFAVHTLSGNIGFATGAPVTAFLMAAIGWRGTLATVGLLGVPVVLSILLQCSILKDQVRTVPKTEGAILSGRELLLNRTMLLFFLFFLFGAMATGGIQAWLVTVLHTVKGIELQLAATALTAYMVGSTMGVLVGGWYADRFRDHILPFVSGLVCLSATMMIVIDWVNLPGLAIIPITFIAGLSLGSSRTPRDILLKDAAPPGQIGKVFGFVSSGLPLGGAITPIPFGYLIDKGYPQMVLMLVAGILFVSLLFGGSAKASSRRGAPVAVAAE